MKADSNQVIKLQFRSLSKEAHDKAREKARVHVESFNFQAMSLDEQIVVMDENLLLLKQEKQDFPWQDYLLYAEDEEALSKVYRDNYIFYHDHEAEKLLQTLILHEKVKAMEKRMKEVQFRQPPFTLRRFLASDYNVVFYRLQRKPISTTESDYARMKNLQARSLMDCTASLSLKFRESFEKLSREDEARYDDLADEAKVVRMLLDPLANLDEDHFITHLKQLKAMRRFRLPENEGQFHRLFVESLAEEGKDACLCPKEYQQCLKDITSFTIPAVPVFCLALIKYEEWLNDLLYNGLVAAARAEQYYDQLFVTIMKNSGSHAGQWIRRFKQNYPCREMNRETYRTILHERMTQQKIALDRISVKEYFRYMGEYDRVKCCFIDHCMKTQAAEFHRRELANTIKTWRIIRFIEKELCRTGQGAGSNSLDLNRLHLDTSKLIAFMVPNRSILEKMKDNDEKAMEAAANRVPSCFIREDYSLRFSGIFDEAFDNLSNLLEEMPYDEKMIYASKCLHDIKLLEYKLQSGEHALHGYYARLLILLNFQVEYLNSLPQSRLAALNTGQAQGAFVQDGFCLGFTKDEKWLKTVLTRIDKRYQIVDERTSITYLVQVLTCPNLELLTEKIYLHCNTTVFRILVDILKPYFTNLTFVNIGRCGLFISHLGNTITNDDLKGSKTKKTHIIREMSTYLA